MTGSPAGSSQTDSAHERHFGEDPWSVCCTGSTESSSKKSAARRRFVTRAADGGGVGSWKVGGTAVEHKTSGMVKAIEDAGGSRSSRAGCARPSPAEVWSRDTEEGLSSLMLPDRMPKDSLKGWIGGVRTIAEGVQNTVDRLAEENAAVDPPKGECEVVVWPFQGVQSVSGAGL